MKFSWIEPDVLPASGIPISEDDIRSLHEQGIRAVLSLTEYPLIGKYDLSAELFQELDMVYYHSPVPDQHPPGEEQARDILRFIQAAHEQQRPVLVHCHAGIGRTGTILHLYYLSQGYSFEEARNQVRQRRNQSTLLSEAQTQFLLHFVKPTDWIDK